MKSLIIFSSFLIFTLSSCATIFIPKKQKINIITKNDESEVYLDNSLIGKGNSFTTKIQKKGIRNVVIQTPGYEDQHEVMVPYKKTAAFYPLFTLDVITLMGYVIDGMVWEKFHSYGKSITYESRFPIRKKQENDKYISLNNVAVNIANKDKDFKFYAITYDHKNLEKAISQAEINTDIEAEKLKIKQEKKNQKKGITSKELNQNNQINVIDNTRLSSRVRKNIYTNGYVDTINKVFQDEKNTIILDGKLTKVKWYNIYSRHKQGSFNRVSLDMTWYIKNNYNEIIDSVSSTVSSGDYTKIKESTIDSIYQDAVNRSYNELHNNDKFLNILKRETIQEFKEEKLKLNNPKNKVSINEDATLASVIIKRKDGGHGSGFAITNDGYILTNYHVVSGRLANKQSEIDVILSNGITLNATIVRFNKDHDLALLKIDYNFEKAFDIPTTKSYKNMLEVYTIGAPKSIELGQSISIGLISNERNVNNISVIQMNMSVNSGNSGGPLYDKTGALHGVVRSKLVGYATEGVGFAVPAYKINEYLNLQF